MSTSFSERVINTICSVGNALSAAVGNAPEDIKARKELGILDAATEEEREMGIEQEKPPVVHKRRPRFD